MEVTRGQMVEKELDAMIERRSRNGEVDPDEREELWRESVSAHNARRREENRLAWREYHEGQAERHRRILEDLIARHDRAARRLTATYEEGEGVRS